MENIMIELANGATFVEPSSGDFENADALVDWLLELPPSAGWLETGIGWIRTDRIVRVDDTEHDVFSRND